MSMKLHVDKIKREMGLRGWSVYDLAKVIGRTPQAVYIMFYSGKTKAATYDLIANALDVDVKDIIK